MTWRDRETERSLERIRRGDVSRAIGVILAKDNRIVGLDLLRGWALVWMVFSHAIPGWPPGIGYMVFIVVGGSLWRRRLGRRWLEIVGAGVISAPFAMGLGQNGFNILLAWGVMLPVFYMVRNVSPIWQTVMAVQLLWYWPLGGSNPGLLWFGWLVGQSFGPVVIGRAGEKLPDLMLIRWIARRPLTFYTAHLMVVWAVLV